jgi:MOSC domain-containing protein YiiM
VAEKGIQEDRRYFGRTSRSTGQPSRRQVTLIEREQIAEHAAALGLEGIRAGEVRSNIETTEVDLQQLMGREVQVGEAVMRFYEPRTPCAKMDALFPGLRQLMENGRQGVLACVVRPGVVRVGDAIRPVE